MQRENGENKKKGSGVEVEWWDEEAQEEKRNIQRERGRGRRRRAVGTGISLEKSAEHPCLLGLWIPPIISFAIIHTPPLSLSPPFSLFLPLYIYIYIFHRYPCSHPFALSGLISKKGWLILLNAATKRRWVQSQSMPSLPPCIHPVFVLIVIKLLTFSTSSFTHINLDFGFSFLFVFVVVVKTLLVLNALNPRTQKNICDIHLMQKPNEGKKIVN